MILPLEGVDAEPLQDEPAGLALEGLDHGDPCRMVRDIEGHLRRRRRVALARLDDIFAQRMAQPVQELAGEVLPHLGNHVV